MPTKIINKLNQNKKLQIALLTSLSCLVIAITILTILISQNIFSNKFEKYSEEREVIKEALGK